MPPLFTFLGLPLYSLFVSEGELEAAIRPTLLAIGVGVGLWLILLVIGLMRSAASLDKERCDEIDRLAAIDESPLRIGFDPAKHKIMEGNKQCAAYRIAVTNSGAKTVKNVRLRIDAIGSNKRTYAKNAQRFVGYKLSICRVPSESQRAYDERPDDCIDLQMGDTVIFECIRLCHRPGNIRLWHSNVFKNTQTNNWESRPHPSLDAGKYAITLSAIGDDLPPVTQCFEFWATKRSLIFRKVVH